MTKMTNKELKEENEKLKETITNLLIYVNENMLPNKDGLYSGFQVDMMIASHLDHEELANFIQDIQ